MCYLCRHHKISVCKYIKKCEQKCEQEYEQKCEQKCDKCCLPVDEALAKQRGYIEYIMSLIDKYSADLNEYVKNGDAPQVIDITEILLQNLVSQQQNLNTLHQATLTLVCKCEESD